MKSWERKFRVLNMGCVGYYSTQEKAVRSIELFGGFLLASEELAFIGKVQDNSQNIGA